MRIITCIQSLRIRGKLQQTIYMAIIQLIESGQTTITAEMVKDKCFMINNQIPWDGRVPAICNSMRNTRKCGGRIVGEDRDFNGFTIEFNI